MSEDLEAELTKSSGKLSRYISWLADAVMNLSFLSGCMHMGRCFAMISTGIVCLQLKHIIVFFCSCGGSGVCFCVSEFFGCD